MYLTSSPYGLTHIGETGPIYMPHGFLGGVLLKDSCYNFPKQVNNS